MIVSGDISPQFMYNFEKCCNIVGLWFHSYITLCKIINFIVKIEQSASGA